MKMRKTVYPIAIIIALPLVLMVFVVLNQVILSSWRKNNLFKTSKTALINQQMSIFAGRGLVIPK